jgi:hypothetical protein
MDQHFRVNLEEIIQQERMRLRGDAEQLVIRDFDPNKADLFKRLRLTQNGSTVTVVQAAMMKSGVVVTSFGEVGRCRCCRQYDAMSVMTLCCRCRLVACMDCMQELDGRLLCLPCGEKELMKKRLKACGNALAKTAQWLWRTHIEF